MCTAASFINGKAYFGRTLDYEFSYGEKVVIAPRCFPFNFRYLGVNNKHYAIIGTAHVSDGYPMFYDAMNECGLGMAGLNFVGNAKYNSYIDGKTNVCQFELIAYVLCNCKNVDEAVSLFNTINVCDTAYNEYYKTAELHYIIRDKNRCIVVEMMADGVHIYDNPVGVLTNNPPFNYQLNNLKNYMNLSNGDPTGSFKPLGDSFYSRGMGAIGLPGDLSSMSRFVRASFTAYYSKADLDEKSSVNQFFHILNSVSQTRGCCLYKDKYEITIYTSCMNLDDGIYYYTTYDNSQINGISLHKEDLENNELIIFPMLKGNLIIQNS